MPELITKLEQLRQYMRAGDYHQALKLAAGWQRLGPARDDIQRAWAALNHPEFYREIGQDPDRLVAAGIAAMTARYEETGK